MTSYTLLFINTRALTLTHRHARGLFESELDETKIRLIVAHTGHDCQQVTLGPALVLSPAVVIARAVAGKGGKAIAGQDSGQSQDVRT